MLFYSVILSVYSVILSEAGSSQRELRAQSKDPGNVCATVITARHSPRALDHPERNRVHHLTGLRPAAFRMSPELRIQRDSELQN